MRAFSSTGPASAAEAVEATVEAGAEATFLAGGTSLYSLMKLVVDRPAALVDVSRWPN